MKKFTNFTKKIFIFFLIFNLTCVGSAQATATFVDSFDVADQGNLPDAVTFNNDGTKMFVVGSNGDAVNEYTLTTGFDVSTASYAGDDERFSVASQNTQIRGLAFNNNGTKMFVVGTKDDDITICDHTSRKICKKGAIVIGGNIFENLYAIIKSKGNYYFVVVHHNRDHTPGEFVVISPDRFHEIGFKVVELTDEDKISKQKTKDKAKQKKNEAAKSKQVGFKKKITLSCTYISSVGMLTENYQFEGHNVSWNGIPVELGVESNGLLVTRENTNIVKADLNGMVYTVNLKRETAMYEFIGQIITATCMKF